MIIRLLATLHSPLVNAKICIKKINGTYLTVFCTLLRSQICLKQQQITPPSYSKIKDQYSFEIDKRCLYKDYYRVIF